jgi:hypothetical protein
MTLDDLKHVSKDEILGRLGLMTKPDPFDYLLPALGIFGAGLVLGVGLGLMLAPKPGAELRGELAERYSRAKHSLRHEQSPATSTAKPNLA